MIHKTRNYSLQDSLLHQLVFYKIHKYLVSEVGIALTTHS